MEGIRVTAIPPTQRYDNTPITRKDNVTFYARVSTETDVQEESYERQKDHFERLIKANSEWNYVDGYADQGISGTKAEARPEFMRMINDCRNGKIDKIYVKSISRFARNTQDVMKYTKELRDLGISIYFENEGIDTLTPNGEILLTILAAMAEQESRTISTNIKWSYDKRFKEGRVLIGSNTLGYKRDPHGDGYIIVEEEAVIVRKIFRDYIAGKTVRDIANEFKKQGYKTRKGNDFKPSSIEMILKNEKYSGNAILGKTFKYDVLSRKRIKNTGQAMQYYLENSHPAIISKELFNKVQVEIKRRAELRNNTSTGKGRYTYKCVFSGLLVCGKCGTNFRRKYRMDKNDGKIYVWTCQQHHTCKENCDMLPIKEEDIYNAYKRAVNRVCGDLSDIVQITKESIEEELKSKYNENLDPISNELKSHRNAMMELFRKRNRGDITQEEYKKQYSIESDIIKNLTDKETQRILADTEMMIKMDKLEEIKTILDSNDLVSKTSIRLLVDSIVVQDKNTMKFIFKCGQSIIEKI